MSYSQNRVISLDTIIYGLALALFLSFPLPQKISSIVIGLLVAVSLYKFFRNPSALRVGWFLPSLFFYYLISELLSDGSWQSLEKRFLLLAVPVAIAVNSGLFSEERRTNIYRAYVLGNVAVALFCLGRSVVRSVQVVGGHWEFNPAVLHDPSKDFLTSSVFGGNYFFGHEYSAFYDPMYFGLFIVFAQCLIFELIRVSTQRREIAWLIGSYFFLWGVLFLLSSKAAILSSLLVAVCITGYIFLKAKATLPIRLAILSVVLVASLLFISFNPRLSLFRETFWERMAINPNARFGHDLRILSWDASLSIIKDNLPFGVGEGRKQTALTEMYNAKGYVFPARDQLNSHSQYLDLLIGGGLVALALFMTGFIQVMVRAVRQRNTLLLTFCLLFAFHALVENLLSRYAGILMFTVFITFLPKIETAKKEQA